MIYIKNRHMTCLLTTGLGRVHHIVGDELSPLHDHSRELGVGRLAPLKHGGGENPREGEGAAVLAEGAGLPNTCI